MKLAVSYDDRGQIVTMFNPDELKGADGTLQYVPAAGEKHEVLDVPTELQNAAFQDLPKLMHVETSGGKVQLAKNA
jgi:hypothetical protein